MKSLLKKIVHASTAMEETHTDLKTPNGEQLLIDGQEATGARTPVDTLYNHVPFIIPRSQYSVNDRGL